MTFLLSIFLWIGSLAVPVAEKPIEWLTETEYDFGDIPAQKPVTRTFRFKNKGDQPLVIETVRTSCGCTGSTWDETPILPDSTGMIQLEFDAKQGGYFRKYARVYFENINGAEKLWVTGFVVEEEE